MNQTAKTRQSTAIPGLVVTITPVNGVILLSFSVNSKFLDTYTVTPGRAMVCGRRHRMPRNIENHIADFAQALADRMAEQVAA